MRDTKHQLNIQSLKEMHDHAREITQCKMRNAALAMAESLFMEEVEKLCGPTYSRNKGNKEHYRNGSDPGSILFQGKRMRVKKPRMKSNDGKEGELVSYAAMQDYDMLCDRVMNHMLAGVSTRDYEPLLDDIARGVGLKKSAVSKAFVRSSKKILDEVNGRELNEHKFASIMIDNNLAERGLRGIVVGRKNYYGNHSKRGARTTSVLYSIIESCKMNKINPQKYLQDVVKMIHQKEEPLTPAEYAQRAVL